MDLIESNEKKTYTHTEKQNKVDCLIRQLEIWALANIVNLESLAAFIFLFV